MVSDGIVDVIDWLRGEVGVGESVLIHDYDMSIIQ